MTSALLPKTGPVLKGSNGRRALGQQPLGATASLRYLPSSLESAQHQQRVGKRRSGDRDLAVKCDKKVVKLARFRKHYIAAPVTM